MADPYSTVSITGYNSNPPADDGSAVEANRVKWSTIKTKLNDPVKTRTDDMDTALVAAFGKIDGGITSTAISYTVLSTDQGKLVRATASGLTITTPDATDVGAPFVFALLNDSDGDITLDGSGSQTVDGVANVTVPAGTGFRLRTEGSNWYTEGQNFQRTLVTPQCYATLLSVAASPLSPMPSSDQTAKTSVYVRPFGGNLMPIPDGTNFAVREFAELTLTLNANHVSGGVYDLFGVDDGSGNIIAVTGPVWNTVTAGSGARGSGANTTELDLLKGLPVNKVAMTGRNGASTYSVGAKCGIFLGSIWIDGTAGQVSCYVSAGQTRKWGISNAWNRQPVELVGTDSTASWTTAPTTWRQSRADSNNYLSTFCCLGNQKIKTGFVQKVASSANSSTSGADIGIGVNVTNALSGKAGSHQLVNNTASVITQTNDLVAEYKLPPSLGINTINPIEQAPSGTTNNSFVGTSTSMRWSAQFLA